MPYALCLFIAVALPAIVIFVLAAKRLRGDYTGASNPSKGILAMAIAELASSFALLLPVSSIDCSLPEKILSALFSVIKMAMIDSDYGSILDDIHTLLGSGLFAATYSVVFQVLSIALPLTIAAAAFEIVRESLPFFRLSISLAKRRDVYVFLGLNRKTLFLAQDVVSKYRDAYLCFAECDKSAKDDCSTALRELRAEAKNRVSVLSVPIERVPVLPKSAGTVHYVLLSDEHDANIDKSIGLLDLLAQKIADSFGGAGSSAEQAFAAAERYSITCLHSNPEAELIVDSCSSCARSGGKGELVRQVRGRIGLRLVCEDEERARSLLRRHPLYEVLDQGLLSDDFQKATQTLNVVIVGLGATGSELLRNCYWLGRIRNTKLRIVAIDLDAARIRDRFKVEYPEMVSDLQKDGSPTISFVDADIFSPDFPTTLREIPRNEPVYTAVSTGDPKRNLSIAIRLRRFFEERHLDDEVANPGCTKRNTREFIALSAHGGDLSDVIDHLKSDREEPFDLVCFGSDKSVFTAENIIADDLEELCLRTHAVYGKVYKFLTAEDRTLDKWREKACRSEEVAGYYRYEIKKRSNMAGVMHLPYRAWMLGIPQPSPAPGEAEWLERLGVKDPQTDIPAIVMNYGKDIDPERLEADYPVVWYGASPRSSTSVGAPSIKPKAGPV